MLVQAFLQTMDGSAATASSKGSSSKGSSSSDASNNDGPIIVRMDALEAMKKGAPFLKYGRIGFPHFREFQLSEDNLRLQWFSSEKSLSDSSIALHDFDEIRLGQTTELFERYPAPELVSASMSVLYQNRERSLDIIAKTPLDFKVWSVGLNALMRKAKQMSDEQLSELRELIIEVKLDRPSQRSMG